MDYYFTSYFDSSIIPAATGNAPDLLAAMIAHLRATPEVVSAFGEDTTSAASTKFHADAARKAELPWAVYEEVGSDTMYMTGTASIETGKIQFAVIASAKKQARDLARLVAEALDEADLVFDDGQLMNLRAGPQFAVPIAAILPGSATGFSHVVVFDFMVQR